MRKALRVGAWLIIVGWAGGAIAEIIREFLGTTQWDLAVYYHACRAWMQGMDPYDVRALQQLSGDPTQLPFLYPPGVLAVFVPLAVLSLAQAKLCWLCAKVLLLARMLTLIRPYLFPRLDPLAIGVVALLGINETLLHDLRAGNVTVVETALLWLGLLCCIRGRVTLYVALVCLGSMFKITALVLLALLPLRAPRARSVLLGLCGMAGLSVLWLWPVTLRPALLGSFAARLHTVWPDPFANPSAMGLLEALAGTTGTSAASGGAPSLPQMAFLAYALVVLCISVRTILKASGAGSTAAAAVTLLLAYLLLMPRLVLYSYVLAIPAALVYLDVCGRRGLRPLLGGLLLICLPVEGWPFTIMPEQVHLYIVSFYRWALVLYLWAWLQLRWPLVGEMGVGPDAATDVASAHASPASDAPFVSA